MGTLACFLWVVCSAARRVICSLVAVCLYPIALTPCLSRAMSDRAEPMPCPGRSGWELGFHLFHGTHGNVQSITQTPCFRPGQSHSWKVLFDFGVDVQGCGVRTFTENFPIGKLSGCFSQRKITTDTDEVSRQVDQTPFMSHRQ